MEGSAKVDIWGVWRLEIHSVELVIRACCCCDVHSPQGHARALFCHGFVLFSLFISLVLYLIHFLKF